MMRREDPSPRSTPSRDTLARRDELMAHPFEWFVWHEEARHAEYGHKVLRALLGVRRGEPMPPMPHRPFEVKVRRNADGATWRVYARWTPLQA